MIAPFGLAIDKERGDLYWCDKARGIIERVSPEGVRSTALANGLKDCMGIAVHGDNVYWADK